MSDRPTGPDGVLLLDKPPGPTSTRALAVARRLLGSRKAGHTGTLDPFASGLLPIAFGEATKFSRFLLESPKTYLATIRLGYRSTTGDPEGEITRGHDFDGDTAAFAEVMACFVGVHQQLPPMHSAIHHGGRRLYEYAREGVEVTRYPRQVEVYKLDVVCISGENAIISVKCSKGTYVRVLAQDIGERIGTGGYLTALRRTAVGEFTLERAVTLEELEPLSVEERAGKLLDPESLLQGLPRCRLDRAQAREFAHGGQVPCEGLAGEVAVFAGDHALLGVGHRDGRGRLDPVRLVRQQPDGPGVRET